MGEALSSKRYLAVKMKQESVVIPLDKVLRILTSPEITPVYLMPAHAVGVLNNRGKIIPVFDLYFFLSGKPQESTEESCVILLEIDKELQLGVLVDEVDGIKEFNSSEEKTLPDSFDQPHHQLFKNLFHSKHQVWCELNLTQFPHLEFAKQGEKNESVP